MVIIYLVKKFLYNNQTLRDRRRELRNNQTKPEEILWQYLSNNKIKGLRFFRQYSVGPYILDFYCPKLRLGIEIDGESHDTSDVKIYDKERTEYLDGADIKILRFKNEEVVSNIEGVLSKIKKMISS